MAKLKVTVKSKEMEYSSPARTVTLKRVTKVPKTESDDVFAYRPSFLSRWNLFSGDALTCLGGEGHPMEAKFAFLLHPLYKAAEAGTGSYLVKKLKEHFLSHGYEVETHSGRIPDDFDEEDADRLVEDALWMLEIADPSVNEDVVADAATSADSNNAEHNAERHEEPQVPATTAKEVPGKETTEIKADTIEPDAVSEPAMKATEEASAEDTGSVKDPFLKKESRPEVVAYFKRVVKVIATKNPEVTVRTGAEYFTFLYQDNVIMTAHPAKSQIFFVFNVKKGEIRVRNGLELITAKYHPGNGDYKYVVTDLNEKGTPAYFHFVEVFKHIDKAKNLGYFPKEEEQDEPVLQVAHSQEGTKQAESPASSNQKEMEALRKAAEKKDRYYCVSQRAHDFGVRHKLQLTRMKTGLYVDEKEKQAYLFPQYTILSTEKGSLYGVSYGSSKFHSYDKGEWKTFVVIHLFGKDLVFSRNRLYEYNNSDMAKLKVEDGRYFIQVKATREYPEGWRDISDHVQKDTPAA